MNYELIVFQQTTDAIGMAAANALLTPIQSAYREAFSNIVIPSFDRATQSMFQQVNEGFNKGTRECKFKGPKKGCCSRLSC